MRCPKCGYISFDYNQLCPKCNKDISDEQAKLNLPTYKNNPPSLLGMLTGAGDDSNVGFTLDSSSALQRAGVDLEFDDSSAMGSSSITLEQEDQELEISLTDDAEEFELPEIDLNDQSGDNEAIELSQESEDLSIGLDEDSIENDLDGVSDTDPGLEIDLDEVSGETEEDKPPTIELNVSDLKINETGELEISSLPDEVLTPAGPPAEDEIEIDELDIGSESDSLIENNITGSLELSELSLDDEDEGLTRENLPEEEEIEIDQIDVGSESDSGIENNITGSLDLSDLTSEDFNDMGGADTVESVASEDSRADDEESLDLGDLTFEEDEEDSLDLSGFSFEDSEKSGDENAETSESINLNGFGPDEEDSLDLGDLAFEEDEEDSLDLSDLTFEDNDDSLPGEGLDLDNEETGELKFADESEDSLKNAASGPEKTVIIDGATSSEKGDLEDTIYNDTLTNAKAVPADDEISLDLENLDLDIDLDDSEDEK